MFKLKHLLLPIFILLIGTTLIQESAAQDTGNIIIEDPTRQSQREYEIRNISISGLISSRESFLLNSSGLREGDRIQIPGAEISNAIRQLYRTGLFSDVEIDYERIGGNGVHIYITVQEQPRLHRYEIEGVRRSHRRDLREQLNLLSGFAVTNSVRQQALKTIERYYRERGHWNTEIDIHEEMTDDGRNRIILTFNIDPGERIKVREINFYGNEEFSEGRLRKEFSEIKQDRWWRIFKRHVFTQDDYDQGIANVLQYYRNNGFRDVRITSDTVYVDDWRRKEGVYFDIYVEEGPQYRIRNIEWEGNTVYSDEELTTLFRFEKGDIFDESRFRENMEGRRDESDISSLYQNNGYLFFQIYPEISLVNGDSLDVTFEIIEDEIATIRRVSFSGNTKTHDDVVRRTIRTVPGQTYSRSNIIRSIRELGQLGYFNPEGIQPDLQPDRENRTVDIIYDLDETQGTDNFEFSGGFGGRQIGVILAARVNFNNFSARRMFEPGGWSPIPSGDGQRLSLGVQVTGRGYQSYSFSFTEPWLRGRPTSFGVNLSYNYSDYSRGRFFGGSQDSDMTFELFTAGLNLGKRLTWPDDYFSRRLILTYNRFMVGSGLSTSIFDESVTNLLTLTGILERNSLDHPISPRNGSKFSISGETALPVPGFSQFYKLRTEYQHHHTLVGQLTLSGMVEYGYMGYFGESSRTNFQRFFIGGTQLQHRQGFERDNIDLRGFPGGPSGTISPVGDNQFQIGGRAFNKYSLELRYPAVSSEQIQLIPYVFMDAGNAFHGLTDFDPFDVKRAVGVGARIFLPILGLVDLSYGYRLDGIPPHAQSSQGIQAGEWEFLFNIGAPF